MRRAGNDGNGRADGGCEPNGVVALLSLTLVGLSGLGLSFAFFGLLVCFNYGGECYREGAVRLGAGIATLALVAALVMVASVGRCAHRVSAAALAAWLACAAAAAVVVF
jgi:hypothetical protein